MGLGPAACDGKVVHGICVLGFKGLKALLAARTPFLFANKLYVGFQVGCRLLWGHSSLAKGFPARGLCLSGGVAGRSDSMNTRFAHAACEVPK